MELDFEGFEKIAEEKPGFDLQGLIYKSYTGISPAYASEICFNAGLDASDRAGQLDGDGNKKTLRQL